MVTKSPSSIHQKREGFAPFLLVVVVEVVVRKGGWEKGRDVIGPCQGIVIASGKEVIGDTEVGDVRGCWEGCPK